MVHALVKCNATCCNDAFFLSIWPLLELRNAWLVSLPGIDKSHLPMPLCADTLFSSVHHTLALQKCFTGDATYRPFIECKLQIIEVLQHRSIRRWPSN